MSAIDLKILESAYRLGLFNKPLSDDMRNCTCRCIHLAWEILEYIESQDLNGATADQISHHLQINDNTARIHARWLYRAGLVDRFYEKRSGAPLLYLKRTKHTRRRI